jgi:2-polyprenyl-6-methoxyphenol hydroxylase-like FAD-dependent oxidoreductase
MDAIIVGGGIGGLVTAIALHQAGVDVRVFESVHTVRPLGVGINLLPHSVRVLDRLGLLPALEGIAVANAELVYFNRQGQKIWQEPRGVAAGYRWPQLSVHRGRLQMLLMQAATERLGPDRIRTGHHLDRFASLPDGRVEARFVDRHTGRALATERAEILIGADGIHSTVRAALHPEDGPPQWAGRLIYRGVSETAPFLTGRSHVAIGGRQVFVAYPISPTHLAEGRSLTNWIAGIEVDPAGGYAREDWNRTAEVERLLPRYESWRFGWLDVPAVMRAAETVFEFPMVDKDPLARWTLGRVTLLGDAAHPMYPVGSNGASQAILDAQALAEAFAGAGHDIDAALARYEAERRPKTAAIVLANRRGGPEGIIRVAEQRAPDGFGDLGEVFAPGELEAFMGGYKQLASFDLQTVNG